MARRRWTHRVGPPLAGLLGAPLVRALGATWRVRVDPPEFLDRLRGGSPRVFAFWHGRLLVPSYVSRGLGVMAMISRHADGEVIARIAAGLGHGSVRGSTTRGGAAALHDAVEALRSGRDVAVTPDGPKGPYEVAQAGAVYAASRGRAPLVPLGVGVRRAWVFVSWDRFLVPKPFTTVALAVGEVMRPPEDLEGEALEGFRRRLEASLREATARAERLAGAEPR
jgi:lysophospholipid acyltransferase (LPLAT)-like uncharacterized protein